MKTKELIKKTTNMDKLDLIYQLLKAIEYDINEYDIRNILEEVLNSDNDNN